MLYAAGKLGRKSGEIFVDTCGRKERREQWVVNPVLLGLLLLHLVVKKHGLNARERTIGEMDQHLQCSTLGLSLL